MHSATPPRSDHEEIELKLAIAPEDAELLGQHPLLRQHASAPPHAQEISSTYYDTDDGQLRAHGLSLRVRQLEHGSIQTLKQQGGGDAGLYRRNQFETRVNGPGVDLAALRSLLGKHDPSSKLLHNRSLEQALHPVFDTRVTRTTWELRLDDGAEIELAWDHGSLECTGAHEEISEVEMELKAGAPGSLYDFAIELLDTIPMSLATAAKADRGYALCGGPGQNHQAVKFAGVDLSPSMTVEQAFGAIIGACLAQIQGNAFGVVHRDDPEYVHQMRVGLRRLRSALGLFKDAIPFPPALQEELDWLVAQLGLARDWEVLAHSTLETVQHAAPPDIAAPDLPQAAAAMANGKRAQAAAAVHSVRYAKLMLSLQRWLEAAEWRNEAVQWQRSVIDSPVLRFADKTLARNQRRLLRRGSKLRGSDPTLRHRVRIAAKKTRYAMEFFRSLYPARQVKKYVSALAALQDELGQLNDAAVADGLLGELRDTRPELSTAIGFARGFLAALLEHKDRRLFRLWRRFERLSLPHHK
jgi:triphosphatase